MYFSHVWDLHRFLPGCSETAEEQLLQLRVGLLFSSVGSLQGPWAVWGRQPRSCFPLLPWAPGTCSINHLQEGPIQGKLLSCPRLRSAYSGRASKEQEGLEGEILWAVQQSQQGIEGHFPKCPQLISVAVAKDLLEPSHSFECQHCREGPEESFQRVLCFIFDCFHFPFSSEGTQLGQESQPHQKGIYHSRIHYWVKAFSPCLATAGCLCNLLNSLESFKHPCQNSAMKHKKQLVPS